MTPGIPATKEAERIGSWFKASVGKKKKVKETLSHTQVKCDDASL
jgi:hypothetical protein